MFPLASVAFASFFKVPSRPSAFIEASFKSRPYFFKAFDAYGVCFESLRNIERSAVPASLPLIPAFDITPIAAAVSSMLTPKVFAVLPTNFIASLSCVMSYAEFAQAAENTSAILELSFAERPN